ncbi:hypothetical protein PTSG_08411 [Salpingoeca rosetta]|uniref:Vacuolar import and degradation protein n=1 Tax=Salpingoeca rosetta (strain ATCC 50818 / BSB-021) TaxID=946362 RepID=F2UJL7_SALR5|nr:uncharacterized protein PTSG_08411 [Salpingoeca rosetta]EGD77316.1 hypothetical protein PTSG_08411 [Salpingoeca rosetta]|eukprot:XP_004990660.1 hypothetical protein PTSG_08411 [Salpingoeca rosetta]
MPAQGQLRPKRRSGKQHAPLEVDTAFLHPMCKYVGRQCSQRSAYGVSVNFYHVDFSQGRVCGELTIKELARNCQDVTTFFDAELVQTADDFLTRRWGADMDVDIAHWKRLPGFNMAYLRDEDAYDFRTNRFIFMRWKEKFVVPYWEAQEVPGASYAGFYYISFDRLKGAITGYYFFRRSERYQALELKYDHDHAIFPHQQLL